MESDREVQLMAPLSARTYLEAYYELSDPKYKGEMIPLVESFRDCSLILTTALEDTWPGEGWEEPDDRKDSETATEHRMDALRLGAEGDDSSLRSRAIDKVVRSLLEDPENELPILPAAELLSDFLPKLKAALYKHADTLEPSSAFIDLLFEALKNDVQVDLSKFQKFSPRDLSMLVTRLAKPGKMTDLNLSNMPMLTESDLATITGVTNDIQSLCLIDSPQILIDTLVSQYKSCDLYHSDLYKRAIVDGRTELDENGYDYKPLPCTGFSDPNVCSVVQLVLIGVSQFQIRKPALRHADGTMAWDTLTNDTEVPTYMSMRGMRGDDGLQYKKFSLVDTPLTMARLISGILHLLRWGSIARYVFRSQ